MKFNHMIHTEKLGLEAEELQGQYVAAREQDWPVLASMERATRDVWRYSGVFKSLKREMEPTWQQEAWAWLILHNQADLFECLGSRVVPCKDEPTGYIVTWHSHQLSPKDVAAGLMGDENYWAHLMWLAGILIQVKASEKEQAGKECEYLMAKYHRLQKRVIYEIEHDYLHQAATLIGQMQDIKAEFDTIEQIYGVQPGRPMSASG